MSIFFIKDNFGLHLGVSLAPHLFDFGMVIRVSNLKDTKLVLRYVLEITEVSPASL